MKAASTADYVKTSIQFLYENEGLTSSLTDDAAKLLLDWGVAHLNSLTTTDISPEGVDEVARQLRKVMRYINKVVGNASPSPDTEMVDDLLKLADAAITLGQQKPVITEDSRDQT